MFTLILFGNVKLCNLSRWLIRINFDPKYFHVIWFTVHKCDSCGRIFKQAWQVSSPLYFVIFLLLFENSVLRAIDLKLAILQEILDKMIFLCNLYEKLDSRGKVSCYLSCCAHSKILRCVIMISFSSDFS